jgi:branched-chain amino acid transport system substrate-binding protein
MSITRRCALLIAVSVAAQIGLSQTPTLAQSAGQTQGVSASEILIGAFGPLTGPSAWIGLGARDGLTLALNEINEHGGVNGRKLRMIFEGAQTPAESVAAAKKLVEQDHVFVVVLGSGSTGAAAAADYLREAGVPAYNIVGATPKIREPFGKNIFSGVYPDARLLSKFFAEEVARTKPKPKTAGIMVGTYEFPQAELKGLIPQLQALGIEAATVQSFNLGTNDFTAQIVGLTQKKPDVVVFLGNSAEAGRAIKQAPELGLTGVPWVISVAAISPSVPSVAGAAANGIRSIWMFPYFFNDPAPAMQTFEKNWEKAYGKPTAGRPSYVDINGYGDMYVLAYALKQAGKDLSWQKLISTWENLKDVKPTSFGAYAPDVIFPESFSPDHRDGNTKYSTIEVVNGAWRVVSK